MQPNEITEVLNRPISQELLARDLTRLAALDRHVLRSPGVQPPLSPVEA